MTANDLQRLPDDSQRYELVQGELRKVPPAGAEHFDIASEVGTSMRVYAREHGLGRVLIGDAGFRLTRDPDTVRAPDVAFIAQPRWVAAESRVGFWEGAPDLALEVISPHDLYTDVEEKVTTWLEHGTRLVFVVNPRHHRVAVHRPGQPVRILTDADSLEGEDVVPGWAMPVRDLFLA
jgi:Uma2 family endonuclease